MAATLTSITPYLKEVYQGRIREQLNTETVTLKRIMRSEAGVTSEIGGKYVTFPVHTRRNSGIGARNEMIRLQAICLDLQARQAYSRFSRRAQEIIDYMMPE